jgi:hypothetical protein
MICHSDLINSLLCTSQTQTEIDRFMGRLFDKEPPTVRSASVSAPSSSENPPSIGFTVSFGLLYICN